MKNAAFKWEVKEVLKIVVKKVVTEAVNNVGYDGNFQMSYKELVKNFGGDEAPTGYYVSIRRGVGDNFQSHIETLFEHEQGGGFISVKVNNHTTFHNGMWGEMMDYKEFSHEEERS
jgi:hypothetical protein